MDARLMWQLSTSWEGLQDYFSTCSVIQEIHTSFPLFHFILNWEVGHLRDLKKTYSCVQLICMARQSEAKKYRTIQFYFSVQDF